MKLWFTTVVNPFEYSMLQINQDHFLQTDDDDSNGSGDKFMKMPLNDNSGNDDSFNNHHHLLQS